MAVDDEGFIYATGYGYDLVNPQSNKDYFTVKLDPVIGDTIWTALYTRTNTSRAAANSILIDSSRSIYVTGKVQFSGDSYNVVKIKIKYSPGGEVLWIGESGIDFRGRPL